MDWCVHLANCSAVTKRLSDSDNCVRGNCSHVYCCLSRRTGSRSTMCLRLSVSMAQRRCPPSGPIELSPRLRAPAISVWRTERKPAPYCSSHIQRRDSRPDCVTRCEIQLANRIIPPLDGMRLQELRRSTRRFRLSSRIAWLRNIIDCNHLIYTPLVHVAAG